MGGFFQNIGFLVGAGVDAGAAPFSLEAVAVIMVPKVVQTIKRHLQFQEVLILSKSSLRFSHV
jgi:hypothetical protein